MMFRYLKFDPSRHGREERFKQLRRILDLLLMKTGGDVDEALEYMEMLGDRHEWFDDAYGFEDFKADLMREGTVREDRTAVGGGLTLTGKGERSLRREALERIFAGLAATRGGEHETRHAGGLGEQSEETRPYEFGDSLEQIAWTPTLKNALARTGVHDGRLSLAEQDFEIAEREASASCATVLLVDISHSMVLYGEDRMLPAREVALALLELITTRYRKDTLDLVLFGDEAHHVPLDQIPYIQAGPFHTNTKAGLQMAQEILKGRKNVNQRIFMVTDGKPSTIWRDGRLYKNPFGLDEEIRNRTLDEATRCRKAGIEVTTFMVASDPILVDFIEEFTELCRGRAYFTGTENLGATLFVDFMRNRRTHLR